MIYSAYSIKIEIATKIKISMHKLQNGQLLCTAWNFLLGWSLASLLPCQSRSMKI